MSLIGNLFRSPSKVNRVASRAHVARKNRAAFGVESLEARELKSGDIPGVSLMYGGISIQATRAGGNTALVENLDSSRIKVTLNENSVIFDQSQVGQIWSVTYSGDQKGQGGFDSFKNNTSLTSSVSMYGGHNTVIGGSGWDFVMVTQGNNYVETGAGGGIVYAFGGSGDQIKDDSDVWVSSYSYDPYYYARYY